ncbi:hypothetical protein [Caulobacter sp. 17J65-9]|uniref:hypothetical protein n=1 Tax=Caulobacter sp. 17J65-9 TaxID=2709382 RepID=UPI0013CAA751|nr:hypothetical protein [Caulobacter sp. 17J65-9]NEX92722.1 hypothetical protein [Caulobacter sp. 17J65-9]
MSMTVLYPVADNAERALAAPVARAAREREARTRGKGEVRFVVEEAGPAFETRDAAMDAYAGRLEDDRPGKRTVLPPEDRYCSLREVLAAERGRRPALGPISPTYEDGRRWPQPARHHRTVWRLSIAYWKLVGAEEAKALIQARSARRDPHAETLEPDALRAMARQPLKPVKPQQPLDVGLFEYRPPEAPDTIIPDE